MASHESQDHRLDMAHYMPMYVELGLHNAYVLLQGKNVAATCMVYTRYIAIPCTSALYVRCKMSHEYNTITILYILCIYTKACRVYYVIQGVCTMYCTMYL